MPRARLSRLSKLSPDLAAKLFAEHHIVGMRQRRNGEIVQVKHAALGWMTPQVYYGLQKVHDLIPIVGPVLAGAYQLKWAIAQKGISVAGVDLPIGAAVYGEALALGFILIIDPIGFAQRAAPIMALGIPPLDEFQLRKFRQDAASEGSLLIFGVLAPFGEILLAWALIRIFLGRSYRWNDFFADVVWALQGFPTIGAGLPGPFEVPGAKPPHGPAPPSHGG